MFPDVVFRSYLWFLEKPVWKSTHSAGTDHELTPGELQRDWSHTLGTRTGFVPERPQSRGGCAARKASPGGGISRSVTEVWEFNTRTLSPHKLHVPKGLWLRLEMGTGGGQMKSQKFWAARPHRCSKRAGRSKLQFPTVLTLFQGERVDTFR